MFHNRNMEKASHEVDWENVLKSTQKEAQMYLHLLFHSFAVFIVSSKWKIVIIKIIIRVQTIECSAQTF